MGMELRSLKRDSNRLRCLAAGGMRASRPTVMRYSLAIAIRRDGGIPPYGMGDIQT